MHTHMTAQIPVSSAQGQFAYLFRQGIKYLGAERWEDAEKVFSEIIAQKSSYRENGRSAREMLKVAKNEREGRQALKQGDLLRALDCFREAENLERTIYVEGLVQIDDFEKRAKAYFEVGHFRQSAWIYDQLLRNYGQDSRASIWKDAQSACWHEELVPVFDKGILALEKKDWHEAKQHFTEVVCGDPDFRRHGQATAVLLDQCKREIRKLANTLLDKGKLKEALREYEEIMDMRKIEQVKELIYLQTQGEKAANEYRRDEKWTKAVAVYEWLLTLKIGVDKHQEWQDLMNDCLQKARLTHLFDKGLQAMSQKQWRIAEKTFSEAKSIDPKFQRRGQRVMRLYRMAVVKQRLTTLFP